MLPQIIVRKLQPFARVPTPSGDGLSLDIYTNRFFTIRPGDRRSVGTDLSIQLPAGFTYLLQETEDMAKSGLTVLAGAYHGPGSELVVLLNHTGRMLWDSNKGDVIARLTIIPVERPEVVVEPEGEPS